MNSLFSNTIWTTIWSDNTFIAKFIIFIILTLLLLSIKMFLSHWSRYAREEHGLLRVIDNLKFWRESKMESKEEYIIENYESTEQNREDLEILETNEANILGDDISDSLIVEDSKFEEVAIGGEEDEDVEVMHQAPIELLKENVSADLIIFDRLVALEENKKAKARINVSVLQKLSELKESKEWTAQFPKYVMTLSMLLGMLGTFIGLTIMVGDISKIMGGVSSQSNDLLTFSNSFREIQTTLKGVSTAFSTTLAGLSCTIITSFLNFLLSQRKASLFDKLEKFTAQDLIPSTFPNLEEKTMLETIEDQLEDTFQNLNSTISQNNTTLGELNGLYKKFDNIEDTLTRVLYKGKTFDGQGIIKELNTVNGSLITMIDKYQNKQFLEDFRNLTDHHKKYVGSLNGILSESKWIPRTKIFIVAITILLASIAIFLGLHYFNY